MKNQLKYATLTIVLFFAIQVNAQQQVEFYRAELRADGVPEKYNNINGSPYLFDKWALGTAKTVNNAVSKDVPLKYDEIEDIVLMKSDDGKLMTFSSPVAEFSITDLKDNTIRAFRSGFAATKATNDRSFFEVLQDGKVRLLRKNHKIISENKEYSGAISKRIVDGIKYYLVNTDNIPVVVKLDQKSINALLSDKEAQLTEFTKANKLNLKNHADAAKLIAYYNTL
jgi:hypothetical protein